MLTVDQTRQAEPRAEITTISDNAQEAIYGFAEVV
jgi:hypothetical protein